MAWPSKFAPVAFVTVCRTGSRSMSDLSFVQVRSYLGGMAPGINQHFPYGELILRIPAVGERAQGHPFDLMRGNCDARVKPSAHSHGPTRHDSEPTKKPLQGARPNPAGLRMKVLKQGKNA